MIRVRDLAVRYPGGGGIHGIHLDVPSGGTCSIIGPSGCGKTTLLHCLAGLLRPDGGSFQLGIDGDARVGLVQQKDALFPWLTVEQNVELGLRALGRRSDGDDGPLPAGTDPADGILGLLSSLGVESLARAYPGQLSGGERQRVAIARTLASRPEVLLLDEPSSALDAFTREALQDLLLTLQRKHRFTCLSVTHHIEEALFLAERVVVMGRGHVATTIDNPLYPDAEARRHQRFYELAVDLRTRLAEVMPNA